MAELQDEPFEKVADDKDLPPMLMMEQVYGTVGCNNCGYWGRMDGVIDPLDKRHIQFICPECGAVEQVKNPEYNQ